MATYDDIKHYVKRHSGFVPQPCWIAHVKALGGLDVKPAHNRQPGGRKKPCPENKKQAIHNALEALGFFSQSN